MLGTSSMKRSTEAVIVFLLVLVALTTLLPLVYMLISSFRTMTEYIVSPIGFPTKLRFDNFISIATGYTLPVYFGNSLILSVVSLFLSLLVSVPAAYAFAKVPTRWGKRLYLVTISLMMVPIMVTLIPRYIIFSKVGILNSRLSLILSYTAQALPYTVYLLTAGFTGIPTDMVEAAKIDGAGYWQIIANVILPMGRPIIVTVSILNFVSVWNELVQAMMFISSEGLKTITVVVSNMGGRFVTNMPLILTGLLVASIPIIVIYMFFQRYLVTGITMGASK